MVRQASRGPVLQYRFYHATRAERTHTAFAGSTVAAAARAANHAGRERVSFAAWHSRHLALSQGPPLRFEGGWPGIPRELRTGGIQHRYLRREFQLARAGVVSGELPDDRIAATLPPLLWGRIAGGVSEWLRREDESGTSGVRTFAAAIASVPARRARAAASVRWRREISKRSTLPRSYSLLRIFPR